MLGKEGEETEDKNSQNERMTGTTEKTPCARPRPTEEQNEVENDILSSIDEIIKVYDLENRPCKTKATKHGFEYCRDETYDQHSLSNAFKTSGGEQLAKWIKGLQDHIYIDLEKEGQYNIEWKNKTDNKNKFSEIEIKISDRSTKQIGLTIHVFLNSNLIQVKGKLFTIFQNEMLPIISNSVKNGSQVKVQEKNKESEICKEEVLPYWQKKELLALVKQFSPK